MPKFKIFSGIGDPSNHLKSFDSQLSFWASDDETEIEKLIKRGQLREFVKKDKVGSPRKYREPSPRKYTNDRRGDEHSPRVTRRADTISGGIAGGGDTSNARKNTPEGLSMP
ncbi:hypothetical protein LIER_01640 [Lithospermum erythrorhizon]|uniref:Uncharacterized protein n=1 Tax=Lithospermum erythrorhizon TaxID=34254 RepID=A0AAV3NLM9_LITER